MNLYQLKVSRLKGCKWSEELPVHIKYQRLKDLSKQRKVVRLASAGHLVNMEIYCLFGHEIKLINVVINDIRALFEVYEVTKHKGCKHHELLMSINFTDLHKLQFLQLQGWR